MAHLESFQGWETCENSELSCILSLVAAADRFKGPQGFQQQKGTKEMQTVTRLGHCQQPKVEAAEGFFSDRKFLKEEKALAVPEEFKPCGNV